MGEVVHAVEAERWTITSIFASEGLRQRQGGDADAMLRGQFGLQVNADFGVFWSTNIDRHFLEGL